MTDYQVYSLVFSIIALLISLLSFIISLLSFNAGKIATKASLLHQVKISIDTAKTELENRSANMAPLKAKKKRTADEDRELEILMSVYESALEKVINAYEDGCQKYYANLVLQDEFKKSYYNDIQHFVKEFEEKFTGPVTPYTYILKAYNEWHKPKS